MRNFIVAAILLTLAIGFTVTNSIIICNTCDEMLEAIDSGDTERAVKTWEGRRDYISIFSRDSEIDAINAEIDKIGFDKSEENAARLYEVISELKDSEKIGVLNIFRIDIKNKKV